ncbi:MULTISPECIES: Panacea domain-containing protein [unclassified Bartonella]|uniref:Panacea domain-containing protein n=1 Tax=unclassified Bartonella TaxID=2645622 RepID=UPI0020C511AF|nr:MULTISPECIES: type II toxin-antitoxin system antitoxin SocA domain-containing protein [unclassified Bartonella]
MYQVQQIANFFLEKGREEDIRISPMKLIKLVYFAYGWMLAATGKRLFLDRIEAWQHGPVIPALYHEFKDWGRRCIDFYSRMVDLETGEIFIPKMHKNSTDEYTFKLLEIVWNAYKNFSSAHLCNEAHKEGTPWKKVYNGRFGVKLKDHDIEEYFTQKINEYSQSRV